MASGYEKFANERCDVEGGHNDDPPIYEQNIVVPTAPPASIPPDKTQQDPAQQPSQYPSQQKAPEYTSHQPSQYLLQKPPQELLQYPPQQLSQYPPEQSLQYPVQQQSGTYVYLPQVAQPAVQQNVVQLTNDSTSKPNDYFGLALCVALFCCLPFGIFALFKSCEVTSRLEEGDFLGAALSYKEAKRWSMRGLFFGVAWIVLAGIIGFLYFCIAVGVH